MIVYVIRSHITKTFLAHTVLMFPNGSVLTHTISSRSVGSLILKLVSVFPLYDPLVMYVARVTPFFLNSTCDSATPLDIYCPRKVKSPVASLVRLFRTTSAAIPPKSCWSSVGILISETVVPNWGLKNHEVFMLLFSFTILPIHSDVLIEYTSMISPILVEEIEAPPFIVSPPAASTSIPSLSCTMNLTLYQAIADGKVKTTNAHAHSLVNTLLPSASWEVTQ